MLTHILSRSRLEDIIQNLSPFYTGINTFDIILTDKKKKCILKIFQMYFAIYQ